MNYYQEITLLPDSTVPLDFLWQKVYQQIHIALVDNKNEQGNSNIAIAFPEYGSTGFRLGRKLRLFAQEQASFQKLDIAKWLVRLSDYTHIKSVQPVPNSAVPVSYVRQHVKGEKRTNSAMQQKAELWAKKSGAPVAQCLSELSKNKPDNHSRLPFIWVESIHLQGEQKKHRPFPLFIKKVISEKASRGQFNCYGLSHRPEGEQIFATVPHF